MARIRTIKPEFFRHESLQDLEIANPGAYVMLVFAGLWGHCDKVGRFEWKPRTLKLDILPFIEFSMDKTLALLCEAGLIRRYSVDGKEYGEVFSFEKHQRINGKEAQEPEKHPPYNGETIEKQQGSNGEAVEITGREGKGREEEGNGECATSLREVSAPGATKSKSITLSQWIAAVKASGEKIMSEYRPLWDYCEKVGIPADWVEIAWDRFRVRYTEGEKGRKKRYTDWRRVFLRAVEENWLNLWFYSEKDQQFRLSTVGIAADIATKEAA